MDIGDSFVSERREWADPGTGRKLVQLTSGGCFDYHLYYFIPSMTADGRSIVFHRHQRDEVQLYKLDVATGLTTRLTNARTPNCLWRPWLQAPGWGVRDLLSALNTAANEVIYFDSNEIRAVHLHTLADRLLYTVPADRVPNGLTGVSPDGRRFVFVHSDRAWWEANWGTEPKKHEAPPSRLDVLEIATGEVRTLLQLSTWLTHSNFYDNERVLFCHLATEMAMLITDLRGGYYQHLRTQDEWGQTCHYIATRKGIVYEVGSRIGGLYNPDTHERVEYEISVPGGIHTGCDPEGRLWFYESADRATGTRVLYYFEALARGRANQAIPLTSPMRTYWLGQRCHFHPQITPDRSSILFTGGDSRNQTNHLFLLDISDLSDTRTEE